MFLKRSYAEKNYNIKYVKCLSWIKDDSTLRYNKVPLTVSSLKPVKIVDLPVKGILQHFTANTEKEKFYRLDL